MSDNDRDTVNHRIIMWCSSEKDKSLPRTCKFGDREIICAIVKGLDEITADCIPKTLAYFHAYNLRISWLKKSTKPNKNKPPPRNLQAWQIICLFS